MLAVRLPESEVLPLLPATLSIAAVNGPSLCVVAGRFEAIDAFEKLLTSRGTRQSQAAHLACISLRHGRSGDRTAARAPARRESLGADHAVCVLCHRRLDTTAEATSPDYWARHARAAVRFADGITKVSQLPAAVFLEVGPGRLSRHWRRKPPRPQHTRVSLHAGRRTRTWRSRLSARNRGSSLDSGHRARLARHSWRAASSRFAADLPVRTQPTLA